MSTKPTLNPKEKIAANRKLPTYMKKEVRQDEEFKKVCGGVINYLTKNAAKLENGHKWTTITCGSSLILLLRMVVREQE